MMDTKIKHKNRPVGCDAFVKAVVYDGFDFGINFAYSASNLPVLKSAPYFGRYIAAKDHRFQKYWRMKKEILDDHGESLINALCAAAKAENNTLHETWESVQVKLNNARTQIDCTAFTEDIKETIYSLQNGGVAVVGSYHPGVIAVAKNMGGRYLAPMKAWKVEHASALVLKSNLLSELHLNDEQVIIVDGVYGIVDDAFSQKNNSEVTIQTTNNAEPESIAVVDDDSDNEVYLAVTSPLNRSDMLEHEMAYQIGLYDLYDFQQIGVRHLLCNSSALLADDMGLGKSRQAVVAAHILSGHAPTFNEESGELIEAKVVIICPASLIINWTREIRMMVPDATIATQHFDEKCQWLVTNYECIEALLPFAHRFKVMVTDEAHLLKEPTAKRTRLAFDIASKVPCRFILTGTPILNRECEIHTLLRLSGHPVGNIPLKKFEAEFAGESSFRTQLSQRIAEWMLRRKKDVVLKTLKGKQEQRVFIVPSDKNRTRYDAVAKDGSLIALQKIMRLRVMLESIKVETVMETIRELNADDKILVFCEFVETVETLKTLLTAAGIGVVTMTGPDSVKKRQKAVDAFQSDVGVQVFVGTTATAGVGYNLFAANYVIFASLPWTPGLKAQAEDRAYRNGQLRLVIVKIPLLENTIDLDLWEMLKHKQSIATDILDPEEAARVAQLALALQLEGTLEKGPVALCN